MEVYFGTVHRGAPLNDSGEAIRLDWDTREVLARFTARPDPRMDLEINPRGGARGCRGIRVTQDRVYAMGARTVYELTRDLEPIEDHSHDLMLGLHEAALSDTDRIWTTSTRINLAIEYDVGTREMVRLFDPRNMPAFQEALGLSPLDIDLESDQRTRWRGYDFKADKSHLHLNAVAVDGDRVLALFNRFGVIADLTNEKVLARDPALERGHNIEVLPDGTLVSVDTHGRTVRFYDPDTGELIRMIDLMAFPWVKALRQSARQGEDREVAKALFTRGLAFSGDHFLVGLSPASLLLVDWRNHTLEDVYEHSTDVRVAIHGLTIAP